MSTDVPDNETTLLQAILRDPNNDAFRLRYAEHLSRSPSAHAQARAEFIRLQIDLARLTNEHPHWAMLIGRQRELLAEHRAHWERPLRQLCRSKIKTPTKWLKAHLFGAGGVWGFQRGMVEQILAPAERFLAEDRAILAATPVRRVALTHASEMLGMLANEPALNHLDSLHLIGDMELDEELHFLGARAKQAGLAVVEFRFPRLRDVMSESLPSDAPLQDDRPRRGARDSTRPQMASEPLERLNQLLRLPAQRVLFDEPAPEHTATVLALSDWVFVGNLFRTANVWAVAKGYHDSPDDEGRCRRLILLRDPPGPELRRCPYFYAEHS